MAPRAEGVVSHGHLAAIRRHCQMALSVQKVGELLGLVQLRHLLPRWRLLVQTLAHTGEGLLGLEGGLGLVLLLAEEQPDVGRQDAAPEEHALGPQPPQEPPQLRKGKDQADADPAEALVVGGSQDQPVGERLQQPLVQLVGELVAPQPLVLLAAALEQPRPGHQRQGHHQRTLLEHQLEVRLQRAHVLPEEVLAVRVQGHEYHTDTGHVGSQGRRGAVQADQRVGQEGGTEPERHPKAELDEALRIAAGLLQDEGEALLRVDAVAGVHVGVQRDVLVLLVELGEPPPVGALGGQAVGLVDAAHGVRHILPERSARGHLEVQSVGLEDVPEAQLAGARAKDLNPLEVVEHPVHPVPVFDEGFICPQIGDHLVPESFLKEGDRGSG